jgi:hypothetical protein
LEALVVEEALAAVIIVDLIRNVAVLEVEVEAGKWYPLHIHIQQESHLLLLEE